MKKIMPLFFVLIGFISNAYAVNKAPNITQSQIVDICLHGIGIGFAPEKVETFNDRSVFALNNGYIDFIACISQSREELYEELLESIIFAKSKMPETYYFSIVDHAYAPGHEYRLDSGATLPLIKLDASARVLHAKNFKRDQNPQDVINYILSSKL